MHLYYACPILISGSCKHETGAKHASLINTEYLASHKLKLRTISIASDGESQCGEALVHLTFKCRIDLDSPIYNMLHVLPLINLKVDNDNLTVDNDYKHIFKWLQNLLLWDKRHDVHGVYIKPSVICSHFASDDLTSTQIDYLLNPNDWQDVKLAYDMLTKYGLFQTQTRTCCLASIRHESHSRF